MTNLRDQLIVLLLCLLIAGVVVGFVVFVGSLTVQNEARNNARCKAAYGKDWSWTRRSATDCINSKGEGRFLR